MFLEPDQVGLRIIDRQEKRPVTTVESGNLNVGTSMVANYAENMDAIVDNLIGFQRVLKVPSRRGGILRGPRGPR